MKNILEKKKNYITKLYIYKFSILHYYYYYYNVIMLSDSCNNLIETENYEIRLFNESKRIDRHNIRTFDRQSQWATTSLAHCL